MLLLDVVGRPQTVLSDSGSHQIQMRLGHVDDGGTVGGMTIPDLKGMFFQGLQEFHKAGQLGSCMILVRRI